MQASVFLDWQAISLFFFFNFLFMESSQLENTDQWVIEFILIDRYPESTSARDLLLLTLEQLRLWRPSDCCRLATD
jgi:hypothetical protein